VFQSADAVYWKSSVRLSSENVHLVKKSAASFYSYTLLGAGIESVHPYFLSFLYVKRNFMEEICLYHARKM
jgi:hypothetical protein